MIEEVGEVTEKKEGSITIRVKKDSMCECCRLNFLCGEDATVVVEEDKIGEVLEVGDKVILKIEESKFLSVALLLFLAPVFIFLFFIFYFRNLGELKSFLYAFVFVMIYFGLIKIILIKKKNIFKGKVLKKI